MSRHLFVVALLAGASSLLGCGADDRPVLRLAIWSNYVPDEVLAEFERENGCRVDAWHFGSNEELRARLAGRDSRLDVAVPSDFVLPSLVADGLIERLDPARLEGRRHLDPAFAARASDPKDEWSVPYAWGTVGIAWRADRLGETVDSWDAFSDPRAAGHAFLVEEARDAVGAALLRNGADPNSTDPAALERAGATLRQWKKGLQGFTSEVKEALVSGEAWLCQAYNGDAAQARLLRDDLRFAVPKEGGILWVDVLVVPANAPARDLAHRFLEHVLRPEVAARISSGVRYAVCNRDALPLVDPAVRADPVVYAPEDVRARCVLQRDLGTGEEAFSRIWLEVRGGG
jgi:spermidine/putrescine transport system substrate-binding protein